MTIRHHFSNGVADAAGTQTIWYGATTQTVAATDQVRPSDWNSAHDVAYVLGGNTTNASTVSGTDVTIAGMGAISVGGSNGSLVISAPVDVDITMSQWEPVPFGNNTSFSSFGQNTLYFQGLMPAQNLTFTGIELSVSLSSVTSSISHGVSETIRYGLYSRGTGAATSKYDLIASSSFSLAAGFSSNLSGSLSVGDAGTSYTTSSAGTVFGSVLSGQKVLFLPFATLLTGGGDYLLAMHNSTNSVGGTGALRASFLVKTNQTNASYGPLANTTVGISNSNLTNDPMLVIYSATTAGLPASVAATQFSINSQNQLYAFLEA